VAGYRCYFVLDDHVWCAEYLEASDDADAVAKAQQLLPGGGLTAIEIWQGSRLIGRPALAMARH
jgi:hypothetical protein